MENKTNEKKKVGLKEIVLPSSPSLTKRVIEHQIIMQENEQKTELKLHEMEEDNKLKSCCYVLDKTAVQYFTTIGIVSGIMIFAIYKLLINDDPQTQTIYMSLLSSLTGLILPSPVFRKK